MNSTPMNVVAWPRPQVRWNELDLLRKLAGCTSAVFALGMVCAAIFASSYVKEAIVHRFASATALYMDSFITPHLQELANKPQLSDAHRHALETLFAPTAIGRPVVGFRIWVDDQIIFSNDHELVGRRFAPSAGRVRASQGFVAADLDNLHGADDNIQILALGVSILEVYAPVRQSGTGRIIGLAETFEIATNLKLEVTIAQGLVWLVLGACTVGMTFLMFSLCGSRAHEVTRLNYENEQFCARVTGANQRISEINELHMHRVGKDLDEGPMQLVSLALLKLDSLHDIVSKIDSAHHPRVEDVETIRSALTRTLDDIRGLSTSLVPSKIKTLSLADTIRMAARRHVCPDGVSAACTVGVLPDHIPFSIKACLYRFVQDGLEYFRNKSLSYGLRAISEGDYIEVEILSRSELNCAVAHCTDGEEVPGVLRDRVEALGGVFFVRSEFGHNSVIAQFKISAVDTANG